MVSRDKCTACGACVNICPKKCISLVPDANGFYMPVIDKEKCISCGACERICPVLKSRTRATDWKNSQYYALWSTNVIKRKSGSSGGLFYLLAEKIIEEGGIVYGAAFKENCHSLIQTSTSNVSLNDLCKSKYVESNTTDTFKFVKKDLQDGKKVLYCGTSCQIDGLVSFLGKEYENLYLCDFLCHGVPGIGIYQKYISELEKKYGTLKKIGFRSKAFGWESYCIDIEFDKKKKYLKTKFEDPYLTFFFNNFIIRESCLNCHRTDSSQSDITIGDYWNVKNNKLIPNDNKGISLLSIHTEKGKKLFEKINNAEECKVYKLDLKDVEYAFEKPNVFSKKRKYILSQLKDGKSIFKLNSGTKIKGCLYRARAIVQNMKNGDKND